MQAESRLGDVVNDLLRHATIASADKHYVRTGYLILELQFASRLLADRILSSFVPIPPGAPDLTVAVAGGRDIDLSRFIPVPRDKSRLFTDDVRYAIWQPGPHAMLSVLDFQSRNAAIWLEDDDVPAWVASRPLLPFIHALTARTSWTAVHGGSVGLNGRMLLLAGKGKTGKTTAALACISAGWDYAGDDFVFVDSVTGTIEPLYTSARMRTAISEVFSELASTSAELSDETGELRYELRLRDYLGATRIKGGNLAAILLPRRRGAALPEFSPARRADAFAGLLSSTTIGLPGWPDLVAAKVAALTNLAPVYFVDTGQNPAAIPEAFAAFLARV